VISLAAIWIDGFGSHLRINEDVMDALFEWMT
jgi:hypothetical protein